jgi:putative exosortase-associated protein (TIGR04073 family)
MEQWGRRTTAIFFLAFFVAGCSRTNWAERPDENIAARAPRKLARGAVNIVTGPFEILNQPIRLAEKEDRFVPQLAGVVAGVPVGLAYGVGRIFAGAFDIVTAPILVPGRTLIEPEFMSPNLLEWAFY